MGFLFALFTLPVLGPIKGVQWLAQQLTEQAERELMDENRVQGELQELQVRLELGEITEEVYTQQETALLERLRAIWKAKGEG